MAELDDAIAAAEHRPAAYVLRPVGGSYLYKGACRDLHARLKDHRAGRVKHTKHKRPLMLAYHEYCASFTEARQRENYLKSGVGRDFLATLMSARVAERQTQRT